MYIEFYHKSLNGYYRIYNILNNWDDLRYKEFMIQLLTNYQKLLLFWETQLKEDFNRHPWSIKRFKDFRNFRIATDDMFDRLNNMLSQKCKEFNSKNQTHHRVVQGFK